MIHRQPVLSAEHCDEAQQREARDDVTTEGIEGLSQQVAVCDEDEHEPEGDDRLTDPPTHDQQPPRDELNNETATPVTHRSQMGIQVSAYGVTKSRSACTPGVMTKHL